MVEALAKSVAAISFGVLLASAAAWGRGDAQAGQEKAMPCGACHGVDGNSLNPEWPSLAGQVPQYLRKQLLDFRAGLRTDPLMSPMAQALTDRDIDDLVAYFSTRKPKVALAPQAAGAGAALYFRGKSRPHATACIGCHGQRGEGNGAWGKFLAAPPTVLAPAIGGQQGGYLVKQLKAYRDSARKNDLAQVMRDIAKSLSDQEISAVAEFVATLPR